MSGETELQAGGEPSSNPHPPQQESRLSIMSDAEVAVFSDGNTQCLVCYSDLTYRGKTPCDHNAICGVCHLRLRFLHNDKKCPICKSENDSIIVDKDEGGKRYGDYPMWGDEIGAGFVHRTDVGMFFEEGYYGQEILPLFGLGCNVCDFSAGSAVCTPAPPLPGASDDQQGNNKTKLSKPLRALQDHLRTDHRLAFCQLCVDHKRDFVSRLPRFNPRQLQNHLRRGDGPESGFLGHPVCEFCKPKRFYDLAYLHQHLHKEHYKCHVCEKQGLNDQFFKNYQSLEKHFDQQHFLCHDVQCLAARFVVFENELDLRAHELSVHGGTSTGSTKINIAFRTRRAGYDGSGLDDRQAPPSESDFNYGLDGQAFVPAPLPTSNAGGAGTAGSNDANANDDSRLHPLHVQRTQELRAQAAATREQQALNDQQESFPTLQSANASASSSAPLVGWASGTTVQRLHKNRVQAGKVTEEAFPALPTTAAAQSLKKKKAVKGNVGATRRQFVAMTTTASSTAPSYGAAAYSPNTTSARATLPSTTSSPLPSAPNVTANRQQNLAAENFPSLGPPSSTSNRPNYAAANAHAKKNFASSVQSNTDFPSLGSYNNTSITSNNKKKPPAPAPVAAPSLNSTVDFPAPPTSSNPYQGTVRQNVLGGSGKTSQQQQDATFSMTSKASAKVAIEDMKASLGPKRFKQLKKFTREFAEDNLSPEGYVDQSAALFDRGYGDPDFWSFLPSLLESCPNEDASDRASNYMASIRRQQFAVKQQQQQHQRKTNPTAGKSSWGGANKSAANNIMRPPPPSLAPSPIAAAAAAAAPPRTAASLVAGGGGGAQRYQYHPPPPPSSHHVVVPAKKKQNAWGGGQTATVVVAKTKAGSKGLAAAANSTQGGTATKFMAKQQKKQSQQQQQQQQSNQSNNNNKGGKKKKKANNELRNLAFGK